ncbi:MAG: hypothetical protein HY673_13695 [Chloroflexi bacterium]|nr:hypothetical protein [Chloroflexota bacterium]
MASALRVSKTAPAQVIFVSSDDELLGAVKVEGLDPLDPRRLDALNNLRRLRE